MGVDPVLREPREPLAGDRLETVRCARRCRPFHRFAVFARVDALSQKFPSFVASFSGFGERNVGIDAHGKALVLSPEAVTEAPPFAAAGRNQNEQSARVEELERLVTGFRFADRRIGERHASLYVSLTRRSLTARASSADNITTKRPFQISTVPFRAQEIWTLEAPSVASRWALVRAFSSRRIAEGRCLAPRVGGRRHADGVRLSD